MPNRKDEKGQDHDEYLRDTSPTGILAPAGNNFNQTTLAP